MTHDLHLLATLNPELDAPHKPFRSHRYAFTVMTSMVEVAGVTRNEIPIGPWHVRVVMHGAIDLQPRKRGPKWPVTTTYIVNEIANLLASSQLLRSDPGAAGSLPCRFYRLGAELKPKVMKRQVIA
jgi:hypothetical protein